MSVTDMGSELLVAASLRLSGRHTELHVGPCDTEHLDAENAPMDLPYSCAWSARLG